MVTEECIRARLAAITREPAFVQEAASVQINAPLALLQVMLETQAATLAWVLGEQAPKPGPRSCRI